MTVQFSLIANGKKQDFEWEAGRELARDMLAYLRDRLAEQQATLRDITGIGVFRGPGSYTGLRIGLTVLNTLAATNDVAIVGVAGEDWQAECLARLEAGDDDRLVLPEYGGEANITKPRK